MPEFDTYEHIMDVIATAIGEAGYRVVESDDDTLYFEGDKKRFSYVVKLSECEE